MTNKQWKFKIKLRDLANFKFLMDLTEKKKDIFNMHIDVKNVIPSQYIIKVYV